MTAESNIVHVFPECCGWLFVSQHRFLGKWSSERHVLYEQQLVEEGIGLYESSGL